MKRTDSGDGISPFKALTCTLASTIGTGNIIGVGTAIVLGGPGAVFWCWIEVCWELPPSTPKPILP